MTKIAVYPGSFDPITNGHLDIVHRALEFADQLIIAILVNPEKKPLFTVRERIAMIRSVIKEDHRVKIDQFDGLLVNYVRRKNGGMILAAFGGETNSNKD